MSEAALIIVSTALVNNIVLAKFLGLCPLLGSSRRLDNAIGMSAASLIVLTIASGVSHLLDHAVLIPYDLTALRTLSFIVIIALTVQVVRVAIHHGYPLLYQRLGIYLPLITTNCAVLGIALLNSRQSETLSHALLAGFGAGLGFVIVLILFASLRQRLEFSAIPTVLQGTPIALITAGILALAFNGFAGLTP